MYVRDTLHKDSFFCDCGHHGDQFVVSYYSDDGELEEEFTYAEVIIPNMPFWHRVTSALRYVFSPGYILHQTVILNSRETRRLRNFLTNRLIAAKNFHNNN